MWKHTRLIIFGALILALVGCDRLGVNQKDESTGDTSKEVFIQKSQLDASALQYKIDQLNSEVERFNAIILEKDGIIATLQVELATAQGSLDNLSLLAKESEKSKRNIVYIAAISIFLNAILIWLVFRNKRAPKRLALPQSKSEKQDGDSKDKPSAEPQKSESENNEAKKPDAKKPVAKKPAKPAAKTVKKDNNPA